MNIKAIIFDVDGTLADTEDAHRIAFNKTFAENHLNWNWDVALYDKLLKVTGGKERIKYFVESFLPSFAKPADYDGFVKHLHSVAGITLPCWPTDTFPCAPALSNSSMMRARATSNSP
ncbi:MAG: HAD hydrolase-like protein [Steroidobacteraceae bacterium]